MSKISISEIRQIIEKSIDDGHRRFAIFPFGYVGMQIKEVLNVFYNIKPEIIIDNKLCKYNEMILSIEDIKNEDIKEIMFIFACERIDIYQQLKNQLKELVDERLILEFPTMIKLEHRKSLLPKFHTEIGKYSYGPIVKNHYLIEKIGSFCSFAAGVDVVGNHPMEYVSTHPMLYYGQIWGPENCEYKCFKDEKWYFDGVEPHKNQKFTKKTIIGNDVWLGRNVTVLKGVTIGNGVIAGAGSVITKDIPDYAVVVGAPARVVKYRFSEEQIIKLNKIAWWNWPDEKIRESFDDFYLPIDQFIEKHY